MIKIYQIRPSDSDINAANIHGFEAVEKVSAKFDMMLGARKWKDDYARMYTPMYEVDTDDLDQAFESTNLWEDNLVRRLNRGSSSSVGDIFVKDGVCHIVDSFGFKNIGERELGVA